MIKIKKFLGLTLKKIKNVLNSRQRIGLALIILVILGLLGVKILGNKSQNPQYQTAQAEKGTLVVNITSSGQVSSTNNTSISTQASGVVADVFIQNGQLVKVGDKIASLELDLDGNLRATQAWASYQSAQNNLASTQANLFSLQSSMLTGWKSFLDVAQNSTFQNPDGSPNTTMRQLPEFMTKNDDWLAVEAKYKNQQNVISQAQTSLSAAWLNYQQTSPTIYAPISGTVTGLSLQKGTVLVAQSGSTGNATAQKIASIKTNAAAQILINLSEIDVTKIKVGNKATLTLDALPGKTYTGKVISIDTIGGISSGVTSYPAVIGLDTQVPEILPNMNVTAKIITNVKDNVVLVPSAAVQTAGTESTVRIMKNGQVASVSVQIGDSNDTQTEIVSGINEGDAVITSAINTSNTNGRSSGQTTSAFGGGGLGGAFRLGGGGR